MPEMIEKFSHGAPTFSLRGKKNICYFHDADFSSDGTISIWCPSDLDAQAALVGSDASCYFRPTPSASGVFTDWVGMYLDVEPVDWAEVEELLHHAYRLSAPKKLSAQLERVHP